MNNEITVSEQKKILSFNDAVKFTGYKRSYLYRLTASKKIPCYSPFGGKLFFSREELEKWMLSNKKEKGVNA